MAPLGAAAEPAPVTEKEKLARIAGILATYPDLKIEIEGHTDSTGSDDYNQQLSEWRAESVRSYLSQQGVSRAIVGFILGAVM